ncbi:MAG: serine hydrolase [Gammaproteobacteria bacterium]|nr:serine hydrolase [Pseudomonadales bacterium]MCP5348037.1 serine hydrolase [Pseudomonadales bacterium]
MKIGCRAGFALSVLLQVAVAQFSYGQQSYPHADDPIGSVRAVYDGALFPDLAVNTYRNIDRLFPSRVIQTGDRVYPLPRGDQADLTLSFQSNGRTYDLYDYMAINRVGAMLVLKDGEIVFEKYQLGNSEQTRWMSMSVAKTITATLIGAAIKDGLISGLDAQVTDYLPGLLGTAYEGVTVRNVLHMSSGVDWNETYTNPASDRRRLLEAQIAQQPGGMLEVMSQLGRAAEPGSRFNYSTGETQVAGELLRAAVDKPLADYLSEKIWAGFGMEAPATWWLESPDGVEVGGSGISATLRDYGRFGQLLINQGQVRGESIFPDGWVEQAYRPFVNSRGETVEYGFMVWPLEATAGSIHEGAFSAIGIHGQFIYMNPAERVVIVVLSARSKPTGMAIIDDDDLFAAITEILKE